jgi:hypothetical protein
LHTKSHHFSLLPSIFLLFIHYSLHHTSSHATMTGETDQTSIVIRDVVASNSKGATGTESETASTSYSSNMAIRTMAKKEVPKLYEYWKAPTITEKGLSAYHAVGWLLGVMLYSTTSLDLPTIDQTNIVCFESYLMCGLGFPRSKFLVSILNYLKCKAIHLNPNAIGKILKYFCTVVIPP